MSVHLEWYHAQRTRKGWPNIKHRSDHWHVVLPVFLSPLGVTAVDEAGRKSPNIDPENLKYPKALYGGEERSRATIAGDLHQNV